MPTYSWSVPTGNIITGNTYIKDTDNKIQDTMDDLADFVNSSGAYTGQGLMFDYVDKASNQTITGVKTFSNGLIGNVTGNSGTATKLATPRTITLAGDVTGSVSFDGSANISIASTVEDDSHNHIVDNIDGLQTELNLKANLASPSFTGTPTAPTASIGTSNTQVATTAFVPSNGNPSGTIIYTASQTVPSGYLKANGALVSRTTYSSLFNAIGTTFGAGDGSTTFALPDLRGEFIRGFDDSRGVDTGRTFGSSQADELKSHSHSLNNFSLSGSSSGGSTTWKYSGTGNTDSTGGSETRPRNIALLACIKY